LYPLKATVMKKIFYLLVFILTTTTQSNAQCWQKIASGGSHTLAIKNDGTLWAWGQNIWGQLGDGTNTNRNAPVQIGSATDWVTISALSRNSMAIKADGTLWAWGDNTFGQFGIGTNISSNVPVQAGLSNGWLIVSVGDIYTLGLKTDGTIWAWGQNSVGQLGIGSYDNTNIPVQIGTGTDWANISAGYENSAAITTTGTIWTWGSNLFGVLGNGTNTGPVNIPGQVGTETDWQKINNSGTHMMAIKTNGILWGWGNNAYGQLGDGTTINKNSPVQIGTDSDWDTTIAAGALSMALKTDGSRWAWGLNSGGEFGNGTYTSVIQPQQIGFDTDWQILSMTETGFGIRTGGNLWGWGANINGQIGNGTTTNSNIPVPISCNIILPVTWLYVNGQLQNGNAIIKWATASESNTNRFEIEYSSNGISYTKIGTVTAAGNSSSTLRYEYLHTSPAIGKNYYRIKQIDLDGRFTYSAVIVLDNVTAKNIFIAPNSVQHSATIYFKETSSKTIRLLNTNGQLVLEQLIQQGSNSQTLDMHHLSAGMYLLQVQTGNNTEVYKIIKE
jgi:alpha-tubulin suppressor-like RCC1 family protein